MVIANDVQNGLILLEGNKSTFKSSIAKELSKCFSCEIVKGIPKGQRSLLSNYNGNSDAQQFLESFWKEIIEIGRNKLVIVDRTYITPIVFRGAFREEMRDFVFIDNDQRIRIEQHIMKLPYVLLFFNDVPENIWNRYNERGTHDNPQTDYIKDIDEISLLNKRYEHFMKRETLLDYYPVECQSFGTLVFNDIKNYIISHMRNRK
jgi:thymidylate kinase